MAAQKRKRNAEEALKYLDKEMKKRRLDFSSKDWAERSSFNEVPNMKSGSARDQKAFRKCKELVEQFRKMKEVAPFLKIDDKAVWYQDYKRKIKKIMDFEILARNLRAPNKYKTVHEFADDMRLIWDNAMRYNLPNSVYWPSAKRFLKLFDEHFNRHMSKIYPCETLHFIFEAVTDFLIAADKKRYFIEPVDYIALNIASYGSSIKRFFCLNKLKGRCRSYTSEKQFLSDMNTIFNNAKTFNARGTDVHAVATILQEKGHELLKTELDKLRSAHLNRTPAHKKTSKGHPRSVDAAQTSIMQEPRTAKPQYFQPVTQEQKVWLREHFYQLDEDRLPAIIEKLQPFCDQNADDGEDPEIDLEDLPPKVLKSTYDYVKDSLKAQQEINKGAGII